MSRLLYCTLAALLCAEAYATIDVLSFATKNSATAFRCPKLTFACTPPSACGYDRTLDKYYCCDPGQGAVCNAFATDCSGSNDRSPGTGQIGCSSGDNAFCCLAKRESCTQRFNQVNVCWATATNPLTNFTAEEMNSTYTSLISASPSATLVTFDTDQLLASSTPISTGSSSVASTASATTQTSATTSTSPPATSSAASGGSSGSSGATIGGAVGGVVGGLALIGTAGFLLWRRRKSKKAASTKDLAGASVGGGGDRGSNYAGSVQPPHGGYSPQNAAAHPYTDSQNPYSTNQNLYGAYAPTAPQHGTEKYAQHGEPIEMDAMSNTVAEVPGNAPPMQEAPGSEPARTSDKNPFAHEEDERVPRDHEPLLGEGSSRDPKR